MNKLRDYYSEDSYINKNYGTQNLEKIIKATLKRKKFSPEMKEIVVEVVKRRVEEFELSPDELKQDLLSLSENLNKIQFSPCKSSNGGFMGVFIKSRKKIIINTLFFDNFFRIYGSKVTAKLLYEVLTHELYHSMGIETDKNSPNYGKDRIAHYDDYNLNIYQTALMEAIIETAADRTSNNRSKFDFFNYKKETQGYSDLTFIVPILSNTFGISEKEFLKNSLRGRENLLNYLDTVIGKDNYSREYLNKIEFALGNMHSACYKKRMNEEEKYQVLKENIFEIYSSVSDVLLYRLENQKIDMNDPSRLINELLSSRRAIVVLLMNQFSDFMGPIKSQALSSLNSCQNGVEIRRRLSNLLTVDLITKSGKSKINHGSKEYFKIIEMIRTGNLIGNEEEVTRMLVGNAEQSEVLTEYLIQSNNPRINDFNEKLEEERYRIDYNSEMTWSNLYVESVLLKQYKKNRETFLNKLKRRLGFKRPLLLNAPADIEVSQNDFVKTLADSSQKRTDDNYTYQENKKRNAGNIDKDFLDGRDD